MKNLIRKIETFYKLAAGANLAAKINMFKSELQKEVMKGVAKINALSQMREYRKSKTLVDFDDAFGKIAQLNFSINELNYLDVIKEINGSMTLLSFVCSRSNVGTGFDPITELGGKDSLSAYVGRIKMIIDEFQRSIKGI
jgi:hypothetical protein